MGIDRARLAHPAAKVPTLPTIEVFRHLVAEHVDCLAVSTAHGHTAGVGEVVRLVRSKFKDLTLIAGNVTSAAGVSFLAECGANAIKIGQGPGSICTTRIVAGVGIPQLTALYVAGSAAKKRNVRLLADGRFRSESFGEEWNAGPTAVLEAGNVTWVVGSRAVSLYDRSFFLRHGQDPARFDAVVIKSPHCQHHMYAAWCARMIDIDAPGSSSANLRSLGHTRCPRPIFPLDAEVPFAPAARIVSRPPHRRPAP